MSSKISPNGLGIALAAVSGLYMLIISLVGLAGKAADTVAAMQQWHIWYDLTAGGIVLGIIEAAVFSYVAGYIIAAVYNKVA